MNLTHRRQALATTLALEDDRGGAASGIAPDRLLGDLGALDAGTRHAEAISEIAQRARDRAPAAAHRPARHPCLLPVGRLLVDDEIKGPDLSDQVGERSERLVAGEGQLDGQRQLELTVDGRRPERPGVDRLHRTAAYR